MSDVKLGQLIDTEQQRDAIHIAVAPVVAAVKLSPGQDIGFIGDDRIRVAGRGEKDIGIVDPFLNHMVLPEQKFWMFLYPNTVTGMRHEWQHPEFKSPVAVPTDKAESEHWLHDFIGRSNCPDYHTVIAAAIGNDSHQWSPDYLHFDGRDASGDIPPEFWDHVEVVTGEKIPQEKRATFFSCSC